MRQRKKVVVPAPTHNPDGTLTARGAMVEARKLYGNMATISGDDALPRMVWCIGQSERTIGKGKTWEDALRRARPADPKLLPKGEVA